MAKVDPNGNENREVCGYQLGVNVIKGFGCLLEVGFSISGVHA